LATGRIRACCGLLFAALGAPRRPPAGGRSTLQ
jgi:hypothetical protein